MRPFLLWSAILASTAGLTGCGASNKVVTADPLTPSPVEPPADGFQANDPAKK